MNVPPAGLHVDLSFNVLLVCLLGFQTWEKRGAMVTVTDCEDGMMKKEQEHQYFVRPPPS